MKRIIIFLVILIQINANPATKDDIKMLIHQMDKRFEQIDKRFEAMQSQMDQRFEVMQSHMDVRFDTITNIMMVMLAGIFTMIGYMVWDRKTILKQSKEEIELNILKQLETKADKTALEKIATIIEKIVENNKEAKEIFKKHRLTFQA